MDTDFIINSEKLTKSYKLYNTHPDRIKETFHPFRKKYHTTFNALSDVSFQIKKGKCVGIIGRNGSGKSTLLQIICGVLTPTSGAIHVSGRVSALLELGAGFNPDFTGRENVYLNSAILGLKQEEIDACFDNIVDFADIGKFIDQPVKTYSSGMYIRLAFAVAVNVDPEILVVDEALAVGDEIFQRKCFSRMQKIKENGCTILFVSHSATTIMEFCDRAILLDAGEILAIGSPKDIISKYHKLIFAPKGRVTDLRNKFKELFNKREQCSKAPTAITECNVKKGKNNNESEARVTDTTSSYDQYDPNLVSKSTVSYESRGALIKNPRIINIDGTKVNILRRGREYFYKYDVNFLDHAFKVRLGMMIKTVSGIEIGGLTSHSSDSGINNIERETLLTAEFRFCCNLTPGIYFMNCGVMGVVEGEETFLHRLVDAAIFRIQPEIELTCTGIVDFGSSLPSVYKIVNNQDN